MLLFRPTKQIRPRRLEHAFQVVLSLSTSTPTPAATPFTATALTSALETQTSRDAQNSLDQRNRQRIIWLFQKGRLDQSRELLLRSGIRDAGLWNKVLGSCAKAGQRHMWEFYRQMLSEKVIPTQSTYHVLFTAKLTDTYTWKKLCDAFRDMKQFGVKGGLKHYTVMVRGFASRGMMSELHQLFKDIRADQVKLDAMFFNQACTSTLDLERPGPARQLRDDSTTKQKHAVAERLRTYLLAVMKQHGVAWDASTYVALMRIHAQRGSVLEVCALFDAVQQDPCVVVDIRIYTAIIGCFARQGDMTKMLHYYAMLQKSAITPDIVLFTVMLDNLVRSDHVATISFTHIWAEIKEVGLVPDRRLLNTALQAFLKTGNSAEFQRTLELMRQLQLDPGGDEYAKLIRLHAMKGELDAMVRAIETVRTTISMNGDVLAAILESLAQLGQAAQMKLYYTKYVKARNLCPAPSLYEKMIECCSEAGDMTAAAEMYQDSFVGNFRKQAVPLTKTFEKQKTPEQNERHGLLRKQQQQQQQLESKLLASNARSSLRPTYTPLTSSSNPPAPQRVVAPLQAQPQADTKDASIPTSQAAVSPTAQALAVAATSTTYIPEVFTSFIMYTTACPLAAPYFSLFRR